MKRTFEAQSRIVVANDKLSEIIDSDRYQSVNTHEIIDCDKIQSKNVPQNKTEIIIA